MRASGICTVSSGDADTYAYVCVYAYADGLNGDAEHRHEQVATYESQILWHFRA